MSIANSLEKTKLRVFNNETSTYWPEASTRTKKYEKGPEGGTMGLHTSP